MNIEKVTAGFRGIRRPAFTVCVILCGFQSWHAFKVYYSLSWYDSVYDVVYCSIATYLGK
jgi:hypothetical protein